MIPLRCSFQSMGPYAIFCQGLHCSSAPCGLLSQSLQALAASAYRPFAGIDVDFMELLIPVRNYTDFMEMSLEIIIINASISNH